MIAEGSVRDIEVFTLFFVVDVASVEHKRIDVGGSGAGAVNYGGV